MDGDTAARYGRLLIPLLVVMVVLVARNSRPRRLRPSALWIRPLIFVVLIGAGLLTAPPPSSPIAIAAMILAVVVGAALGWQRGRLMQIDVHPETHDVTQRASPLGMIFILVLLGVRMGIRDVAFGSGGIAGLSAGVIASALILLVGAMIIAQSVEMFLRTRRLLDEAKNASAASTGPRTPPNPPIVQ